MSAGPVSSGRLALTARIALTAGIALMAAAGVLRAQPWSAYGADGVERFTPGEGAGVGVQFYPGNVLGLPDSTALPEVPTVDGAQILALGLGGEIVLRFDRAPIVDGPGPDFTVFENAFRYTIGGRERTYAEPGQVAVSRDGVEFVAFGFDTLTLHGCAGVTPTDGGRDPAEPSVAGGDAFDLADVGLDSVRYVRIRDVTAIVKENRAHPFWDATLNGFDLDAVVAAHHAAAGVGIAAHGDASAIVMPNPVTGSTALLSLRTVRAEHVRAVAFDALGRDRGVIADGAAPAGDSRLVLDVSRLEPGTYLVRVALEGAVPMSARLVVVR